MKPSCSNCGSDLSSWSAFVRGPSDVVDGRIRMSECSVMFMLSCDECSETLRLVDADSKEGHDHLNWKSEGALR